MRSPSPDEPGPPRPPSTQPDPDPGSGPSVEPVDAAQEGDSRQETPHQPYDQQIPPGYGGTGPVGGAGRSCPAAGGTPGCGLTPWTGDGLAPRLPARLRDH